MIYVVFEWVKILMWVAILAMAICGRKCISINVFWVTVISSLMVIASEVHNLLCPPMYTGKSLFWFFTNIIVGIGYILLLRECSMTSERYHKKSNELMRKMKTDLDEIQEQVKNQIEV